MERWSMEHSGVANLNLKKAKTGLLTLTRKLHFKTPHNFNLKQVIWKVWLSLKQNKKPDDFDLIGHL